jgi:hypothetical protein
MLTHFALGTKLDAEGNGVNGGYARGDDCSLFKA